MRTEIALSNIKEMIEKDGIEFIMKESKRLLDSGAIDKDKFVDDEFALPKIVLTVVLESLADQYRPRHDEYKEDVENLKHF